MTPETIAQIRSERQHLVAQVEAMDALLEVVGNGTGNHTGNHTTTAIPPIPTTFRDKVRLGLSHGPLSTEALVTYLRLNGVKPRKGKLRAVVPLTLSQLRSRGEAVVTSNGWQLVPRAGV